MNKNSGRKSSKITKVPGEIYTFFDGQKQSVVADLI